MEDEIRNEKEILALALAGTTAFSVFGSALSANAWSWPSSTDTKYDVDAYQSYVPVATEINASYTAGAEAEVTEYAYRDIILIQTLLVSIPMLKSKHT